MGASPSFGVRHVAACIALLVVLVGSLALHARSLDIPHDRQEQHDIYFSFVEGQRLLAGHNPYARVLEGDFRTNDKYATYFPLFYELSALSQALGLRAYADWLWFWRLVFAAFDVGIAIVLFETCRRGGSLLLGVFGAALWSLGRWGIFVTLIGNMDTMPIFFLLLSLLWRRTRPVAALLLFGLSLSLKQIGIFLGPLYLIWAWQDAPRNERWGAVARATAWIALVPLVVSIPFLVWNAQGFIGSVLFSATRSARAHLGLVSADVRLGIDGPLGRVPLLLGLACVYALAAARTIGVYTSCLLTFAVFTNFNSVFYLHYPAWMLPFLPTAALDARADRSP